MLITLSTGLSSRLTLTIPKIIRHSNEDRMSWDKRWLKIVNHFELQVGKGFISYRQLNLASGVYVPT